ncbi:Uncharacterised protein [Lysinibacillus sphaericus]|nr:Uncharacterised protein [Lysinibacillus sphaericus]
MKNTDIEFLKELQAELKTQETDWQAAPRYWGIMNYRTVPAHEDYNATDTSYFHNDGDHTEFKQLADLKGFLTDYYLDDLEGDEADELRVLLAEEDDAEFYELWQFVTERLNDNGHFNEVPTREEEFIVTSAMFLTKQEAKRHLELNHYHYSPKAHTYAMTAWRAPKVERLLKILETFDWDRVKVTEVPE